MALPERPRRRDHSTREEGRDVPTATVEDSSRRRPSAPPPARAGRTGPRRSLDRLARAILWVVVGAVLGGLLGAVYGYLTPPQYAVRSDLLIESDISLTGDLQTFEVTERDVVTQRSLLASPTVAAEASARSGMDLGEASTSVTQDSNILTVDVVQPTDALARQALEAYVGAYLDLVAARQRTQLEGELAVATGSAEAAVAEAARLDAVVAAAPQDEQVVLLNQQAAQRTVLAAQQREATERAGRLESALARLPVNLQRIDEAPVPERSGLSLTQWALLGLVAGAAGGVLIVMRLAERRD